jgi:hypothetical protein
MPDAPLAFILSCIERRRIYWTYHVNMRMAERSISRDQVIGASEGYQIIENYAGEKHLPSCLVLATGSEVFHVLFALDVESDTVRVVTAYKPDPREWEADLKTRRKSE